MLKFKENDYRTDLNNFFKLSGCMSSKRLSHNPFIVFNETDDDIIVEIIDNAQLLARNYTPDTKVMAQWSGQWSSDFFKFTVLDVIMYLETGSV